MTASGLFKVIVSFQDSHGNPLSEDGYKVRVYDQDPIHDDFLGESTLNDSGVAELLISVSDMFSLDSPADRTPDLYFVLYRNDKRVFRTDTINDVDFETSDPVTGRVKQLTRKFGPYPAPV